MNLPITTNALTQIFYFKFSLQELRWIKFYKYILYKLSSNNLMRRYIVLN